MLIGIANAVVGDDCRKYFSIIKRMYGEYVAAIGSENMIRKVI